MGSHLNFKDTNRPVTFSEPEGELPSDAPYMYVAKIEVSDLDAMGSFLGTDEGKEFVKSWSVFIDPTAIFTIGHEV